MKRNFPFNDRYRMERIEDCRMLYAKYGGRNHERIEQEMRELGHCDFHRRTLYSRFARGRHAPGWIEKYGFDDPAQMPSATELADWAASVEHERRAPGPRNDAIRWRVLGPHGPVAAASDSEGPKPHDATSKPTPPAFDEFQEWLKRVSPNYDWHFPHQVYLYKKLRRFYLGLIDRLMIFMPPRHGKSEMVTVRYAAWLLKQDPSKNIVVASYNQKLANRFSRKIKGVLADDWAMTSRESGKSSESSVSLESGKRQLQHPKDSRDSQHSKDSQNAQNSQNFPNSQTSQNSPYPNGSPFPFASRRRANTDAEWETSLGGGLRAVGVGSGITGFGADVIFIDDPIKSRAEAESAAYRDRVWNWFNDDIYTRLEPDGKICIIQTRWHEDDLAGRLLKEAAEGGDQWEVVDLPALSEPPASAGGKQAEGPVNGFGTPNAKDGIADTSSAKDVAADTVVSGVKPRVIGYPRLYSKLAEPSASASGTHTDIANVLGKEGSAKACPIDSRDPFFGSQPPAGTGGSERNDPLGRAPGEALWPERFSVKKLLRIKQKLGSYSFGALYQQKPVPADGGLFKRDWFKIIPRAPFGLRWRRATDPGLLSNAKADYTASFRVAFDRENNFYIDGGFRKQLEYPDLRRFVLGRMLAEGDTFEHGIERSAHGRALEQDLGREPMLRGKPLRGLDIKDGKVPRALPWIALAEQGKVFLTRAAWNRDFIDECLAFPLGTHDDQIDAVSLGFEMSRRTNGKLHRF